METGKFLAYSARKPSGAKRTGEQEMGPKSKMNQKLSWRRSLEEVRLELNSFRKLNEGEKWCF